MGFLYNLLVFILCINSKLSYCINPESSCNEQGVVYRDSNYTVCDCFDCFYGEHCEFEDDSCIIDATDGNPLFYNKYWQNQTNNTAPSDDTQSVVIDPYYRTGYQYDTTILPPSNIPISKQDGIEYYLRESILNLHKIVGNVNTDNKYIVIGHGCTQLINAIIYGFSLVESKPLTVFAQTPYYQRYKLFAQFNPVLSVWNDSYLQQQNRDLIEFVTIPNNPDGVMRTKYYKNNKYTVYDMVYNWPSIASNMTKHIDFDYMLFSMSKLTGNAGTRIGWAFVRNQSVAQYMAQFIDMMNLVPSIDAVYRTVFLLEQLSGREDTFFDAIRAEFHSRWDVILSLFQAQNKYYLLSEYGTFYLWIKTNDMNVNLCDVLLEYNIRGEAANEYGATDNFCRVSIEQHVSTFNLLIKKLKAFLAG